MKIDIKKVMVFVREDHADIISIEIEAPAPTYPYTANVTFDTKAVEGTGADWVRNNFKHEPEVVVFPKYPDLKIKR